MLYKKYLRRTKSKLNNITFVYSTIQLFILTLLFRQQKVGGNFRTGKERTPKKTSGTFTLHCAQLCSQRRLLLLLCSAATQLYIKLNLVLKRTISLLKTILFTFFLPQINLSGHLNSPLIFWAFSTQTPFSSTCHILRSMLLKTYNFKKF